MVVEEFISQLKLQEIYFIMQEVGGHAGICAFMKNPQWLKGIILTDTIIFPVSQYPKIARMLNLVNGPIFNFFNSNFNIIINRLTGAGVRRRKLDIMEKQTYKSMFSTKQSRRTITTMLHELSEREELLSEVQRAFETRFSCLPALLIYGQKDPLTKLGVPDRISRTMKNVSSHLIMGEGHFPHEGAPEEMSDLIIRWIGQRSK